MNFHQNPSMLTNVFKLQISPMRRPSISGGPKCLKYQNVPYIRNFWHIGKPWNRFQRWVIIIYFLTVQDDHSVVVGWCRCCVTDDRSDFTLGHPSLTIAHPSLIQEVTIKESQLLDTMLQHQPLWTQQYSMLWEASIPTNEFLFWKTHRWTRRPNNPELTPH